MSSNPSVNVDWEYRMCPLDTDPDRLGAFKDIMSKWQRKRGAGASLPSRKEFDFYDFSGWHGRIFIAKIERNPFNLRFSLWGTILTEWWNVDYTNKTLGEESMDPKLWHQAELKYFEAMDRDPFIGIASGYLTQHSRSYIKVLGLDLPLSDGYGLSHVISIHQRIELDQSVAEILPDCPLSDFVFR